MKFRNLSSEEIEVRVQSVAKNDKGAILLLYKDAILFIFTLAS